MSRSDWWFLAVALMVCVVCVVVIAWLMLRH